MGYILCFFHYKHRQYTVKWLLKQCKYFFWSWNNFVTSFVKFFVTMFICHKATKRFYRFLGSLLYKIKRKVNRKFIWTSYDKSKEQNDRLKIVRRLGFIWHWSESHLNQNYGETFLGAYGNVVRDIAYPTPNEIEMTRPRGKSDHQIVFDNLCANLSQQMSFYDATDLMLP